MECRSNIKLPQTGYNDMINERHEILRPNETRHMKSWHSKNDLLFVTLVGGHLQNDKTNMKTNSLGTEKSRMIVICQANCAIICRGVMRVNRKCTKHCNNKYLESAVAKFSSLPIWPLIGI